MESDKRKIRLGIIGYGQRGRAILTGVLADMAEQGIEIAAVCDAYEDRAREAADFVASKIGNMPLCTTDYREMLDMRELDAVIIMSSWESHVPIALDAMRAGKYVGMEVGGAYSIEECRKLVETYEKTGVPCMMLENCCYGRREMMVMRMAEEGVFGDIMYCTGGYEHDLRYEISNGEELRHYRLRNYIHRCCENYPTHALGPIAQILHINRGNRFVSLSSVSSSSKGLNEYIRREKGENSPLANMRFAQGDAVTTVIRCARGETVTLTLDTTLPRYYSRGFSVHGTKGLYTEETDSVFLDGIHNKYEFNWKSQWGNAEEYAEKYEHPIWREYKNNIKGGHDGMDWLVFSAFADCVRSSSEPPIDVYDAAAWMCISQLSEESIAKGGAPVAVPDFTGGRWMSRTFG